LSVFGRSACPDTVNSFNCPYPGICSFDASISCSDNRFDTDSLNDTDPSNDLALIDFAASTYHARTLNNSIGVFIQTYYEFIPDYVRINDLSPPAGTTFKPGQAVNLSANVQYERTEADGLGLRVVYLDSDGVLMDELPLVISENVLETEGKEGVGNSVC
jgi:hypothetical protein